MSGYRTESDEWAGPLLTAADITDAIQAFRLAVGVALAKFLNDVDAGKAQIFVAHALMSDALHDLIPATTGPQLRQIEQEESDR
ncbi:MAG: hypothetical protein ACREDY_20445 [Bradyrhizobium sp.]